MQKDFDAVKTLSVEFKVKPNEVVAAVNRQKDQLKKLQMQLKKLKKDAWKSHISDWIASIEKVNGIPFGFVLVDDFGGDELRDMLGALLAQKGAFYFIISNCDTRSSFIAAASPELQNKIDWKAFGAWLKEHGLRGGGKNMIQGGGQRIDAGLKQEIMDWLN